MTGFQRLTPRLRLVADFVTPGRKLADVGTDHAYLPAALIEEGLTPSAVACDIVAGPLARARETVEAAGLTRAVRLALSDGLAAVEPAEADEIVIAGMGGDLIAALIARCPWLREPDKHLVLQPMSKEGRLRRFLCRSGFAIRGEAVAREGERLYLVLSAAYDGRKRETDEFFELAGTLPARLAAFEKRGGRETDAALLAQNMRAYLLKRARAVQRRAQGLARAADPQARARAGQAAALAQALRQAAGPGGAPEPERGEMK